MSGGKETSEAPKINEAKEAQEISRGVVKVQEDLNRATIEPAAEVQAKEDLTPAAAETLEKDVKAAVDAVPPAAEAIPAVITLKAAETEGSMIIEGADPAADGRPGTEDEGEGEPEGGAVTEGEMDPDPVDGGNAGQSGVDPVSGVSPPAREGTGPADPGQQMAGTVPGEVSGFVEGDGSAAAALRGDGETQLSDFSDQISEKESLDLEAQDLVQEAPREVATSPAQESTAPASDIPALTQDDVKAAPSSQPIQAASEVESISSGESNENTAKVTGAVPSQGAGLPVDDDSETSSLPPYNGPGVGLDSVSGVLETQEAISTGESVSESAPLDVNALVQSVLREAYLENTQDLQFYADKVKYFNECKKQVRDYVNQVREQVADIKDNEELTIPITLTEETADGSSSDVTQELNLTMEEAVRFLALEVEEDTTGDNDSDDGSDDGSDDSSDLPLAPDINDYMVPKLDADGNPIVDADGNPILVPDMDAYTAAMEEYVATLTGAAEGEVAQDGSEASDEFQEQIDELNIRKTELQEMLVKQEVCSSRLITLAAGGKPDVYGVVHYHDTIPVFLYIKQEDGSYQTVNIGVVNNYDQASSFIAPVGGNMQSLLNDIAGITAQIQNLIAEKTEQEIQDLENSMDD